MKNYLRNSIVLASAGLTLSLAGCFEMTDPKPEPAPAPAPQLDIVETAVGDGRFTTLVAAVTEADLVDTLQSPGPFTVFAPTDDAFGLYLEANELEAADLLEADNLGDILTYHVLGSEVNAAAATALAGDNGAFANTTATVNGKKVALSVNSGELYINTAKVIVPDVGASNGVIHALDRVLDVPKDVPANVDVECSEDGSLPTIAQLATDTPALSTLLSAVTGGNADSVAALLSGDANLTVFAPTNAAFSAIESDTLTGILADPAVLTNLLENHVFGGGAVDAVGAYSLNGVTVDAAGDADLSFLIDPTSRNLKVNAATVVSTDIYACNGIVHVIDAVL